MATGAAARTETLGSLKTAVVGVGAVGQLMIALLRERGVPAGRLRVLARTARRVSLNGDTFSVAEVTPEAFDGLDVAFFAGGEDKDNHFGPIAVERGAVVIDNGDAFRMEPAVPLVVPEINADTLARHKGMIASPNCSAIQLAMVLAPLANLAPIRRVVCSTYQSVSGKGRAALERLDAEARAVVTGEALPDGSPFAEPILGNLACDWPVVEGGHTREEVKVVAETRKVLGAPLLPIAINTTRVPVPNAHAQAVNIEFERPVSPDAARAALASFPGLQVTDDFPSPRMADGTDAVWVGRLRRDDSVAHGLWLWSACDNLRKGAALNAIQIAETLLARGLLPR